MAAAFEATVMAASSIEAMGEAGAALAAPTRCRSTDATRNSF